MSPGRWAALPAAALLAACGPLHGAEHDHRSLRCLAVITCDSREEVMEHAATGLQAAGMAEALPILRQRLETLFLAPLPEGAAARKPAHLFLLTSGAPGAGVVATASLVPLAGDSEACLEALGERYEAMERDGSVRLFAGARDPSCPDLLFAAPAEDHLLASSSLAGLRWLAARRRDRDTPAAANLAMPLRMTLHLPAAAAAAGGHAPERRQMLDACAGAFPTVDIGLDADARRLSLLLRANAADGSPMAAAIAALRPLSPEMDRLLPAERRAAAAGSVLGLLPALPEGTAVWLEDLAASLRLAGLQVLPGGRGWLAALTPCLNGEYVSGLLLPSASSQGFSAVRVFGLRDAARAGEIVATLLTSPPPGTSLRAVTNLPPRRRGGTPIRSYRPAPPLPAAATNRLDLAELGEVLIRLMDLETVEMAVSGNRLIVLQGAAGSIDKWLDHPPPAGSPVLAAVGSRFPRAAAPEDVLGVWSLEPLAVLRDIVARLPGTNARQMTTFPRPGDGVAWRLTRRGAALEWELCLPANEVFAWRQMRRLDPQLLHEAMFEAVLQQTRKHAEEAVRREVLRKQLQLPAPRR